MLNTYTQGSNS